MYTKLNDLTAPKRKSRKRLGRGQGSGLGKTSGRGQKGQKSRTGVSLLGFEGGQTPLFRRLPKRGFNNARFANRFEEINLLDLVRANKSGRLSIDTQITAKELCKGGLIRKVSSKVKLLAKGKDDFSLKLDIKVDKFSISAKEAIEKSGGSVA